MRILYIVQHFAAPTQAGGARPYENARRLVSRGHEVTLLCGASDHITDTDLAIVREAGIAIHRAPVEYRSRMSYFQRLMSFRAYMTWATATGKQLPRPDLVFASSTPLTIGEIGRRVAAHHQVPFVFEVRDLWPEVPITLGALNNPLLRWSARRMARRVYAAAQHVVALSPDMRRQIIAAWGVPAERVTVIPNCSDTTFFGSREPRERERERLQWDGKFVCTHPGAMGLVNGLDYVLDCARVLDARGVTDILLALVGDGARKPHLAARIAAEGIKSAVLSDPIPKRAMPALLAAADVGLVTVAPLPFLETNSANKFFDFLAAGLPTIVNYGGWQAAELKESGAGLSVDPHDPACLADALIHLRDNPDARTAMGQAARRIAEERFDRDKLVAQLDHVLRAVQAGTQPMPVG